MKSLRLRGEARTELIHEVEYYEEQRTGAGRAFRLAVDAAFRLIRRFPAAGAPAPAGTRRTKVKGFPFIVVYREETTQIVVFALAADRRQPGYWSHRLD